MKKRNVMSIMLVILMILGTTYTPIMAKEYVSATPGTKSLTAQVIDYGEKLIYGEHFIKIVVPEKEMNIKEIKIIPSATALAVGTTPLDASYLVAKKWDGLSLENAKKTETATETTYEFYSVPPVDGYTYHYDIEVKTDNKTEPYKTTAIPGAASVPGTNTPGVVPIVSQKFDIQIGQIDNFGATHTLNYKEELKGRYYNELKNIYNTQTTPVKDTISSQYIPVLMETETITKFQDNKLYLASLAGATTKSYKDKLEYTSHEGISKLEGSYLLEAQNQGKKVTQITLDTHVFVGATSNLDAAKSLSQEGARVILSNDKRQQLITYDAIPANNKINTSNPILQGDKSLLMPAFVLDDMSAQLQTIPQGSRKFLQQDMDLKTPKGIFTVKEFLDESIKSNYDFSSNIFIDPVTGLSGGNLKILIVDQTGFSQYVDNLTDIALRVKLRELSLKDYIDIFKNKLLNENPQLRKISVDYMISDLEDSVLPPVIIPLTASEKKHTEIRPEISSNIELNVKLKFEGNVADLTKVCMKVDFSQLPIETIPPLHGTTNTLGQELTERELIKYIPLSASNVKINGSNGSYITTPNPNTIDIVGNYFTEGEIYLITLTVPTELNVEGVSAEMKKEIKQAYYEAYLKKTWESKGVTDVAGTDGENIQKKIKVTIISDFNKLDKDGYPISFNEEVLLSVPYGGDYIIN